MSCGSARVGGDPRLPKATAETHLSGTGRPLAERKRIWVVDHEGGWGVRRGVEWDLISTHDTQAEAHEAAREIARSEGAELVIEGTNGRIAEQDSFGNDPRDIPG